MTGLVLVLVVYLMTALGTAVTVGLGASAILDLRSVIVLGTNGLRRMYALSCLFVQIIYVLLSLYLFLAAFFIIRLERIPSEPDAIMRYWAVGFVAVLIGVASAIQFTTAVRLRKALP